MDYFHLPLPLTHLLIKYTPAKVSDTNKEIKIRSGNHAVIVPMNQLTIDWTCVIKLVGTEITVQVMIYDLYRTKCQI